MIDPKKTLTRRMPRVRLPDDQPLGKIPPAPARQKRSRPQLEEVVVVDKNDPRRERD